MALNAALTVEYDVGPAVPEVAVTETCARDTTVNENKNKSVKIFLIKQNLYK